MDLESIKVLADTATQLTGEAKQVFVWWLLGKEMLGMVLAAGTIITVVCLGYRLIKASTVNAAAEEYFRFKRDQFGTGSRGCLTPNEITRTIAEIEKRLKEANHE